MKKKHIGKIVLLFLLMLMACAGGLIEDYLNAGIDYDEAGRYAFLTATAYTLLTTIIMSAVPFVCRLFNKEKLPYTKGKKLCLWNSIILFFLSMVLQTVIALPFIGGIGALFFYFINKWLFVSSESENEPPTKKCAKNNSVAAQTSHSLYCRKCGSKMSVDSNFCSKCGANIRIDESITTLPSTVDSVNPLVHSSKPSHRSDPWESNHNGSQKKATAKIALIISLVILILAIGITLHNDVKPSSPSNTDEPMEYTYYDDYSGIYYTLESGKEYVGLRTISLPQKETLITAYSEWLNGDASEETMIDIMNKYGNSQGGGQLYLIQRGEFTKEIDSWCFDSGRKHGDVAIIENPFGYSLCYISTLLTENSPPDFYIDANGNIHQN